jgi:hypothetical protein
MYVERINQINIGKSKENSGTILPELVSLNNIKKNPQTISVPKIERDVNLPKLKNLLFKEAYAYTNNIIGSTKNGIII